MIWSLLKPRLRGAPFGESMKVFGV
jgi:hypothetical protein